CTRFFLFEAGVGENVLPACAGALGVLIVATRPAPGLVHTGLALLLALLLRQDNILILPAMLYALWTGSPAGSRVRGLAVLLVATGAAALGCSALAWLHSGAKGESFLDYLLDLGRRDWRLAVAGQPVLAHLDSFGVAAVARHWEPADHQLWV